MADGRLDFGIVRENAVAAEITRWRLGAVGYALFAANPLWKRGLGVKEMMQTSPMVELLTGGQFSQHWQAWLSEQKHKPRILARLASFTDLARVVHAGCAAAVLPVMAAVDFNPKKFRHQAIPGLKSRNLVLIANPRSLDRSGIRAGVGDLLAEVLKIP